MRLPRFSSDWVTAVFLGVGVAASPQQANAQRALGTDVSNYQGPSLNWTTIKNGGNSFAWAKATQSTDFIDADFVTNIVKAKAAGVPIGGYDFAEPGVNTPAAEASYFWSEAGPYVKNDALSIMPMLDYETFGGAIVGATSYSDWANQWCSNIVSLAAAAGVKVTPVIYIGPCNDDSYLNSTVNKWLNNIAVYPGNPQTGNPWTDSTCTTDPGWGRAWNVWQYGDTNISGGDSDVFNGTVTQMLAALVVTAANPIAPAGTALYWDPGAKKASPGSGGIGSWDLHTADWWYTGASNCVWSPSGDNPIFAGTAGTVTLSASLNAGNLTFNTAGYTIAGTANTLTLANSIISVAGPDSSPVNIDCIVAGSGYTVTGGGVLVLNNIADTIAGSVNVVSNTTLVIASNQAIGSGAGTVNINNGGCLQNNDTTSGHLFLSSAYNIALGTGGGYLNDNINSSLTYGGVISGAGNLTKIGGGGGTGGTLTLTGTNTYTGNTTISQGVLALGVNGSINDSATLTIAPGGSLDVSAISAWMLSGNTSLDVSGTGEGVGSTAATIKAASSGTASLGSSSVTLVYTPTATNGDTVHPSLYISQGTLVIGHGNTILIDNASGAALGVGSYTLIQQANGSISGTPYPKPFFSGAGVISGTTNFFVVSGGQLNLIVGRTTTTTLNPLTASSYGQSVTLTATVSPSPSGGTVQFYDNGNALGGAVTVNSGTASYTTTALSVGNHPITAIYSGATLYTGSSTASASTQQITAAPLVITANPESKTYGSLLTFGSGSTSFSSSGLQNGDTIGSVTLSITGNGGAATAPVSGSPYVITPSLATGGTFVAGNYNITYHMGALTVNPATLTVTATSISVLYGATNFAFTATYSNFVNNENLGSSDVFGSPSLSTDQTTNSPIGVYVISNNLGTLTSTNYAFNLVNGILTVTNALSAIALSSFVNPALPGEQVSFLATVSVQLPSLAIPSGTVQYYIDGRIFGLPITLSNGVAPSLYTASLSHGYHNVEADYDGDTNIIGSTNTLIELINTPPVAGPATYSRAQNASLTIAISSLLTNATDADRDPLSLAAVSATSANGAVITTNATSIFYNPPATNGNAPDVFSYTAADIYGATSSNNVTVTVLPPSLNITGITLGNGAVQLNFAGLPGSIYLIQAATNLTPPVTWTPVSTNTADTNGFFNFSDGTVSNYDARYYRAVSQ